MQALRIPRDEVPDFAMLLAPDHMRSLISSKEDFDAHNAAMIPLAETHEAAVLDAMRRAGFGETASAITSEESGSRRDRGTASQGGDLP